MIYSNTESRSFLFKGKFMEWGYYMEKNLRKHITYNSLLIITKLLIVTVTALYFNGKCAIIFLWITILYIVVWGILYILSKRDFKKYFKSMRKLTMIYILFQAPNFVKIDFNPVATIKKQKYSYDTYWLYSYINRRDFEIEDKSLFEDQVTKEIEHLHNRIEKVNYSVIVAFIVSSVIFLFMNVAFPYVASIHMIYVIICSMSLLALTHNMIMKIMVYRNHDIIFKAFEEKKYDKALRYCIVYLGMSNHSLYRTKSTSYLKTFESSYIY
jgi:hypothetical protein